MRPPHFLAVWSSHRPSHNMATCFFRPMGKSVQSAKIESYVTESNLDVTIASSLPLNTASSRSDYYIIMYTDCSFKVIGLRCECLSSLNLIWNLQKDEAGKNYQKLSVSIIHIFFQILYSLCIKALRVKEETDANNKIEINNANTSN